MDRYSLIRKNRYGRRGEELELCIKGVLDCTDRRLDVGQRESNADDLEGRRDRCWLSDQVDKSFYK